MFGVKLEVIGHTIVDKDNRNPQGGDWQIGFWRVFIGPESEVDAEQALDALRNSRIAEDGDKQFKIVPLYADLS